jgi:hypothetical protein
VVGETRLYKVELTKKHQPTGKMRHSIGGEAMPVPSSLLISQFGRDPGFYLLYLDASGKEMTDTWHATLDDAKHQAAFEFSVEDADWQKA